MEEKHPIPLTELKRLRKPVRNTHQLHKEKLSNLEKFTLNFSRRIGSVTFFVLILTTTIVWLAWNTFAPPASRFDPYPAFVLWLFISNITQLLLMPLIMLSQNMQAKFSEVRAEQEFEINIKAEREIETIISHLEKQEAQIAELMKKLEAK